jgi:hypothetical protein
LTATHRQARTAPGPALLLAALVIASSLLGADRATADGVRFRSFPETFFGISTQVPRPDSEFATMRSGGVDSVRIGFPWNGIEPQPGSYDFSAPDRWVAQAVRHGMEAFPFIGATPTWTGAADFRTLPTSESQKQAWASFLRQLVIRYGPGGTYWAEHGPGSADPLPYRPIRIWQLWNEPNFFFFTEPRSPSLYAELVRVSEQAIHAVDPGAQIVLAGLFAKPRQQPPQAYQATDFLDQMYAVPGIKEHFDGVALHPYAVDADDLLDTVADVREVMAENDDAETGLYITEMGWGSATDNAFEKGPEGQVRELTQAFEILRDNPDWRVRRAYWFAWDDLPNSCNFCDSVGLFTQDGQPKASWFRFVEIAGCFGRVLTILGTAGSDTLTGTPGTDVIETLGGDDVVNGGAGDDLICGGDGVDSINGGAGADRALGKQGNDRIFLRSGADWAFGGPGADLLGGAFGADNLIGDGGRDRLLGANGNDRLFGGLGNDVLFGGLGNDFLRGGKGRDRVRGGRGSNDVKQ